MDKDIKGDESILTTKRRIWFEGAIYHVTVRGNHKNNIFLNDGDFIYYLSLLKEAKKYFKDDRYDIVCYCLMDNHVHLLIKTYNKPIGLFMGRVDSIYTRFFNKKYDLVGHLFQDRYHSEIIKDDGQLLEASRYIHLNPVRAKMVEKPEDYMWSSYKMFIEESKKNLILNPSLILDYFSDNDSKSSIKYKAFVENNVSTPGVSP